MDTNKPANSLNDFLANMQADEANPEMPESVAHLFANVSGTTPVQPNRPVLPLNKPPQDSAIAKDIAPALTPAAVPSTDVEHPTAPPSDEFLSPASKRPLAHFGQGRPATKSKANRKLVLQLTPEMYQFFALASALPGLDGVAIPDLALAILQAWREDYRPDIKKAAAAFFKA